VLTLVFYVVDVLHTGGLINFPLAVHFYPLTFVLLVPLIKRNWIPKVSQLEYVGKRSYGVYLVHLLVIDVALWAIHDSMPGLNGFPILVALPVFILALAIPLWIMHLLSAPSTRFVHHYVFG
jgi:peptidoglycan/LPS O-acetylase OafA/YrhL